MIYVKERGVVRTPSEKRHGFGLACKQAWLCFLGERPYLAHLLFPASMPLFCCCRNMCV